MPHLHRAPRSPLLVADDVKQASMSLRRDLDQMRLESNSVVSKRATVKEAMERMMDEAHKVLSCKTCS